MPPSRRQLLRGACAFTGEFVTRDSVLVSVHIPSGETTVVKHGRADEHRAATPGSVIKPLVLSSLMERKLLRSDEAYLCSGYLSVRGRQLNCIHPPMSAPMDIERAVAYSCNCAVADWSRRIAPRDLAGDLVAAGLGVSGSILDVRLLALGQSNIQVTALQLANAYRRYTFPKLVWDGMEGAIRYGTAQAAALPGLDVAGKTGSGGNFAAGRIAWFAGFLPSRTPELVTVVMAAGNSGGADAAPIAREVWRQHLASRWRVGFSPREASASPF